MKQRRPVSSGRHPFPRCRHSGRSQSAAYPQAFAEVWCLPASQCPKGRFALSPKNWICAVVCAHIRSSWRPSALMGADSTYWVRPWRPSSHIAVKPTLWDYCQCVRLSALLSLYSGAQPCNSWTISFSQVSIWASWVSTLLRRVSPVSFPDRLTVTT